MHFLLGKDTQHFVVSSIGLPRTTLPSAVSLSPTTIASYVPPRYYLDSDKREVHMLKIIHCHPIIAAANQSVSELALAICVWPMHSLA